MINGCKNNFFLLNLVKREIILTEHIFLIIFLNDLVTDFSVTAKLNIFFYLKNEKYSTSMFFPLTIFCIVLRLLFSYTMVQYCQNDICMANISSVSLRKMICRKTQ